MDLLPDGTAVHGSDRGPGDTEVPLLLGGGLDRTVGPVGSREGSGWSGPNWAL